MGPEIRGRAIISKSIDAAKRIKDVFKEQPLSEEERARAFEVFEDIGTSVVFTRTHRQSSIFSSAWGIYTKDQLGEEKPLFASVKEVEEKFSTLFNNGYVSLVNLEDPNLTGDQAEYRTTDLGVRSYREFVRSRRQ